MVEKKFKALRFASSLFKVLAWIALVCGIIGAFAVLVLGIAGGALLSNNPDLVEAAPSLSTLTGVFGGVVGGVIGFIGIIIVTLIVFVVLKATSELWEVYISVEHNTRLTAYYVSGGQAPAEPGAMAPPPIQ
ncbi:MAG: hypothetical protein LLG44_14450 [Chloroflexi bacterium]|nr:hypothetical protein [Chloroflexota bacterium]